mmetsp:Transcript_17659/g.52769  ORF Transcript_17659/g.52769 Transcript_17659/m.52769 type:complete len:562 (+) Transcript_17659:2509-4194(+)
MVSITLGICARSSSPLVLIRVEKSRSQKYVLSSESRCEPFRNNWSPSTTEESNASRPQHTKTVAVPTYSSSSSSDHVSQKERSAATLLVMKSIFTFPFKLSNSACRSGLFCTAMSSTCCWLAVKYCTCFLKPAKLIPSFRCSSWGATVHAQGPAGCFGCCSASSPSSSSALPSSRGSSASSSSRASSTRGFRDSSTCKSVPSSPKSPYSRLGCSSSSSEARLTVTSSSSSDESFSGDSAALSSSAGGNASCQLSERIKKLGVFRKALLTTSSGSTSTVSSKYFLPPSLACSSVSARSFISSGSRLKSSSRRSERIFEYARSSSSVFVPGNVAGARPASNCLMLKALAKSNDLPLCLLKYWRHMSFITLPCLSCRSEALISCFVLESCNSSSFATFPFSLCRLAATLASVSACCSASFDRSFATFHSRKARLSATGSLVGLGWSLRSFFASAKAALLFHGQSSLHKMIMTCPGLSCLAVRPFHWIHSRSSGTEVAITIIPPFSFESSFDGKSWPRPPNLSVRVMRKRLSAPVPSAMVDIFRTSCIFCSLIRWRVSSSCSRKI